VNIRSLAERELARLKKGEGGESFLPRSIGLAEELTGDPEFYWSKPAVGKDGA
jgi:hypothetical protein